MGFRKGAYATVWETEQISNNVTKARISVSRKNKNTQEYEQDFGGYVKFIGSAVAQKALGLKAKDRILLGDVDVSTFYSKEKGVTYTDFKIFSFDYADNSNFDNNAPPQSSQRPVDDGEVDDSDLPF